MVEEEGDEPIELPTEQPDKHLLLSTLQAQFPGASGLKYKYINEEKTRCFRGIRLNDGKLYPPCETGGWSSHVYYCVFPKGMWCMTPSLNDQISSFVAI